MRLPSAYTPVWTGMWAAVRVCRTVLLTDSPATTLTRAPARALAASAFAIQTPLVSHQANWATWMVGLLLDGSALMRVTTGSVAAVAPGWGKKYALPGVKSFTSNGAV